MLKLRSALATRGRRARVWMGLGAIAWMAVLLGGTAGCGGNDGPGTQPTIHHPQDYLPTQVSGWEQAGETATGTTEAELEAEIDGGSEIYTSHGMREFAIAAYAGSGSQASATLDIRIYEMNTNQAALDLYNDSRIVPSPIESQPDVGSVARLSSSLLGKALEFVRDAYYVKVEVLGASSEAEARTQVEFFAGNIDQEMTQ